MDMRKFAGKHFIAIDDVRSHPQQERIRKIGEGKYDKPVLEFESGNAFSLNTTNIRSMIKHYGPDGRAWVGHTVELYKGETVYNGQAQASVLVRPISPPRPEDKNLPPEAFEQPDKKDAGNDMNDEIPF